MKYRLIILIVIMCLIICGCSNHSEESPTVAPPTQEPTEPTEPTELKPPSLSIAAGSHCLQYTDESSGKVMNYWLYIPENATEDMPLLVFLHGTGQISAINLLEDFGLMNNVYEIYGNEFPFLVLFPNTTVRTWSQEPVVSVLKSLIDTVAAEYNVDTDHIMITGHSLGAIGTWQMISNHGDYFSVAVPVSYGAPKMINYENMTHVPIRAFVGSLESSCANDMEKIVSKIQDSGGNIQLIRLENCNHSDTVTAPYTAELFQWMLDQ